MQKSIETKIKLLRKYLLKVSKTIDNSIKKM